MFKFIKEQSIFDIAGVKIGGQPGQLPTVMIGSIFYHSDKIVKDEMEGNFDREKAEDLLKQEEEVSERTGNPRIIDIVGASPKALIRYIDFITDVTESPFLLDGTTMNVRIEALKHVADVGLADRAVYNSITPDAKPEEIIAIKEAGLKSAVLLTYNSRKPTMEGRINVLKGPKGLLSLAKEAGIEKPIVDGTILDVPDPGVVAKTIYSIKNEFGLPAGCGAHNSIDRWHARRKLNPATYLMGSLVANVTPIIMGANFLLYGPIKKASESYPPCALADAYVAYSMRQEYELGPLTKQHPLFNIFSRVDG